MSWLSSFLWAISFILACFAFASSCFDPEHFVFLFCIDVSDVLIVFCNIRHNISCDKSVQDGVWSTGKVRCVCTRCTQNSARWPTRVTSVHHLFFQSEVNRKRQLGFRKYPKKFKLFILPYLDAQTKDNLGDTEDLKKEKEGEFGFPFIEKMYILLIFYKKQIHGIKLGHYQWH